MHRVAHTLARILRSAWRELVDATEWATNPNLDRPRIGEHGDVMNPSAGWSAPNPRTGDGQALDHKGEQDG